MKWIKSTIRELQRKARARYLFQDEHIVVVHKPAGFLSVPGKTIKDSASRSGNASRCGRAVRDPPFGHGDLWHSKYSPSSTCKQQSLQKQFIYS
ncbi:hypothetical protein OK016_19855 [Vibrio chagasii]|nr:hypothetical protein [Vibrio chagasii]